MKTDLTAEQFRAVLNYEPETGEFTWLVNRGAARAGKPAGNVSEDGYRQIMIGGFNYRAQRLAWLFVHGSWPSAQIDHMNGIRTDNRLSNLREATHAQNQQNQRKPKCGNRSGFIGVTWHALTSKWAARIMASGKSINLGLFKTPEEANAAYLAAKKELHQFSTIT